MHNSKISKKSIGVGLFIAFIIVGTIASFIVVQQSVDIRNRASELTCRMNLVECSWEWEGQLPSDAGQVEYEYTVSGPCNNTEARPCKGTTTKTSIQFEGYPGGSYVCNVQPKVTVAGKQCDVPFSTGSASCPLQTISDPGTPVTNQTPGDTETIPSSCGCAEDGGKLNCNPENVTDYEVEEGSGLIVLNPIYEVGDNACFACQKIRVTDSSGTVVREVEGCKMPEGEEIRLHQAGTEAGSCETYRVEAIGADGQLESPKTCQTCDHEVCCPACLPPVNLDVPVMSSDPNRPLDMVEVDSCSYGCDFQVDFGGQNQCGASGETMTLNVPDGMCVDIDDDYAKVSEVCDTDEDGKIEVTYDRGGVYDVALDCGSLGSVNVQVGGDVSSASAAAPEDLKCTKRITVACGGSGGTSITTDNNPDDPNLVGDPDEPVDLEIPGDPGEDLTTTTTDPSCRELDVEMICHNCSS